MVSQSSSPAPVETLSFEAALAELEQIVRQLEDGKIKLDDAVAVYERGVALRRHCEARLKEAQLKVEKINLGADGSIGTTPFSAT